MLPIREIEAAILAKLAARNRLVISAPTGSGKTTQVPQMLLRCESVKGQVIVLQPRRLATRMVARRVAEEMGVPLGGVVGYQTRHESHISRETRIRFMTEGLFLRLMQSDPNLPGVGAVVLDEFHERSLDADLSLGLLKQLQAERRPDLRVVVMSATLDVQAVTAYLQCDVAEAMGRMYPVEVSYLPKWSSTPMWDLAAEALRDVLNAEQEGDVLIFMPGAYEIRRTIERCERMVGRGDVAFFPLHGSLPVAEQDAAVAPHRLRKVIVATNVAETSITIPGVRHVIDAGMARVHRYDPRRGINILELAPISHASADQRAGRAGRTAPGTCRRLWTAADHRTRAAHETPEVRRLDLAQALLQMLDMGVVDIRGFDWLQPPETAAVDRAITLLRELRAMDDAERVTKLGDRMARFPAHPRMARMLLEAEQRGCLHRECLWAALISDRDILIGEPKPMFTAGSAEANEPRSDLVVMERAFTAAKDAHFQPHRCTEIGVNATAARETERTHRLFLDVCKGLGMSFAGEDRTVDLIKSLLPAYSDHVAVRREAGRLDCAMPGQKRVVLDKASVVKLPGPLVALEVREIGRGDSIQTTLSMASEVDIAALAELFPDRMATRTAQRWNDDVNAAEEVEQRLFGELVVSEKVRPAAASEQTADMLVQQILTGQLKLEKWDEAVDQWIARTRCVAAWFPERGLIRYDTDDLAVIVHEIVGDATRWNQVKDRPVLQALKDALSWDEQQLVEKMAPGSLRLPAGQTMKIEYPAVPGLPPRGRAKIQHLYGLTDTPRIAAGRIKLVLEILGPNYRPVQITDDLASFWANTYPQLKKELKRRYPRHGWR